MENIYYAAKANDKIRINSASGGVFFVLAQNIINDGGCVYGAAFDEKWNVRHIRVDKVDDLKKLQGSKYSQSDISGIWRQLEIDLKAGKKVLFCGTPCQAQAVQIFGKSYKNNLFVCDIVCHGVASPIIFRDYIGWLQKRNGKILRFSFRDKSLGWKRQVWTATFANKIIKKGTEDVNTYRIMYYKHLMHRPSCFECPYTTVNRLSDITLGDFWGIEKYNLDMYDSLGVSLVIVHSKRGNDLWNRIQNSLIFTQCEEENCLQPQLLSPVVKSDDYEQFNKDFFNKMEYERIARKYGYPPLIQRLKNRIKIVLRKCLEK